MRTVTTLLIALILTPVAADAHPLAPGLLELRELGDGTTELTWKMPVLQPRGAWLEPALPDDCHPMSRPAAIIEGDAVTERSLLRCGSKGWIGRTVGMRGLDQSKTDTLLRVLLDDGRVLTTLLSRTRPTFVVPQRSTRRSVFRRYVELGIEHLLTGLDHVLFVAGLMLLVGGWRPLVKTITAFTAGHSVTLSLAVLGIADPPTAAVELAIAASIVVLAVEITASAAGEQRTIGRRPWLMALAFGLLHGLGFAGALASIGLPQGEIPLALFSFNAGIEIGQLLVVATLLGAARLLRPLLERAPRAVFRLPAYAIGSLAAMWCYERLETLLRGFAA
jgi:hydrogenase/urease accessory protein HupE